MIGHNRARSARVNISFAGQEQQQTGKNDPSYLISHLRLVYIIVERLTRTVLARISLGDLSFGHGRIEVRDCADVMTGRW